MLKKINQRISSNIIVLTVGKFLFPLILLLGFYIQINGDNAPGGGFQAGVIMATAFILHSFVFGTRKTLKIMQPYILRYIAAFGILLYILTGLACIVLGSNYLDYSSLRAVSVEGEKLGIILIEWGVGFTVFAIICHIYYSFLFVRLRSGN